MYIRRSLGSEREIPVKKENPMSKFCLRYVQFTLVIVALQILSSVFSLPAADKYCLPGIFCRSCLGSGGACKGGPGIVSMAQLERCRSGGVKDGKDA
jgi:hypothetical protein